MVMAPAKQRKIDADSHFFPQMDFGDLSEVLPGLSREAQEMVIRDAIMFTNPNARSGGFRATAAGQRVGASNPTGGRSGGPVGHGVVADRVKLLPETGFDMQVLIPDGP